MDVSRSGFCQYLTHGYLYTIDPDLHLILKVRRIHQTTRGSYGSRCMSRQLRNGGDDVGRYRARSLMRKAQVAVKHRKKFKITTESNHKLPIAPNLLERRFEVNSPNCAWYTDITYLWTMQGRLYLAVIIDLFSRKVVGWAMGDRLKTELVKDAVTMAYFRRKPAGG
jgi:transposase InsO family protein